MKRLTFDGNFCDIAQCRYDRWGKHCPDGACSQRKVWEQLKFCEDNFRFRHVKDALPEESGKALCIVGAGGMHFFELLSYHREPWEDCYGETCKAGFYGSDSEYGDYLDDDVLFWVMLPDEEEIVKELEE